MNEHSYRTAASTLWGEAGTAVHDSYTRWRAELFPELPEQLPIVIGITAYGACMGLTRYRADGARISIASSLFAQGRRAVDDVMVHEMAHVYLSQCEEDPAHDGEPWYAAVQRFSPAVLGHELDVRRGGGRRSVRVANPQAGEDGQPATVVRKVAVSGVVPHAQVARWPGPFRPEGYNGGPSIPCPSY